MDSVYYGKALAILSSLPDLLVGYVSGLGQIVDLGHLSDVGLLACLVGWRVASMTRVE
jgi:hypothetical protein